eukprot:TRINITY_DN888_c0_g3_i4.p1 TRINITY_DN888_c0_g3~~TRINITY_DN888_c0_g3_i4.p1  ORF type:complete len:491 (+),score=94.33 TRINITY_DN888_c0_g3_i4:806-2278(+)
MREYISQASSSTQSNNANNSSNTNPRPLPVSNNNNNTNNATVNNGNNNNINALASHVKKEPGVESRSLSREQEQRKKIMENSEQKKIHQNLVGGQILTDDEFWELRSQMVQNELLRMDNQPKGIPSAILSEMSSTGAEGTQQVHIKLTPTIIHQIFAGNPKIKALYEEKVPDSMSENDFWTKYFEATHFHKEKKATSVLQPKVDNPFIKVAEDQKFADSTLVIYNKKLEDRDITIDVSANEENIQEGYGLVMDSNNPINIKASLPVIRKFNRHSQLVLEGSLNKRAKTKYNEGENEQNKYHTLIDDLDKEKPLDAVALNIEDSSVYLKSQNANKGESGMSEEEISINLAGFRSQLMFWKRDPKKCNISSSAASSVITETCNPANTSMKEARGEVELNDISESLKEEVKTLFLLSNELLRHFWSCYPMNNNLKARETRMYNSISSFYTDLQKFQDKNPSVFGSGLLLTIFQSLDKAIDKHDAYEKNIKNKK